MLLLECFFPTPQNSAFGKNLTESIDLNSTQIVSVDEMLQMQMRHFYNQYNPRNSSVLFKLQLFIFLKGLINNTEYKILLSQSEETD